LSQRDLLYQELYSKFYGEKCHLIVEVDLKCRKELAPIELLILFKEQSYDNEVVSEPGAHKVQDPSPGAKVADLLEGPRYSSQVFNATEAHRQLMAPLQSCLCVKMRCGSLS
jgi:hypothetical protein